MRRLALLALMSWLALIGGPALSQTLDIRSALSVPGAGAAFPADVEALEVALPDEWARTRPGFGGTVWYRVRFGALVVPPSDDLLALYVQHVCSNLEVHLNGQMVHSGGRMSSPITHNCNHPQLVALPSALIRSNISVCSTCLLSNCQTVLLASSPHRPARSSRVNPHHGALSTASQATRSAGHACWAQSAR